ncbi:hypothetical protein ACJJTC_006628 [Scirpophaga incertulas]
MKSEGFYVVMENQVMKLLLEEEEEDDLLLYYYYKYKTERRLPIKDLYLTRDQEGSFSLLVKKHLMFDDNIFRKYFRLNKTQFDYVLNLLKKTMQEKGRISVKEKLALTLRFIATGETYASLSFEFLISPSYISQIVKVVLKHLKTVMVPIFMLVPKEKPKNLPNSNIMLPHFLVGDEAFSLDTFMMNPYARRVAKNDLSKEIFNYRLCRARRVSENAFGLLSQVFRIFYTPIGIAPDTCTDMILVLCCLHNLLRDGFLESAQMPVHQWNREEENLPSNFISLRGTRGFSNSSGLDIRVKLTNYFTSQQGAVDWQEQHVTRLV